MGKVIVFCYLIALSSVLCAPATEDQDQVQYVIPAVEPAVEEAEGAAKAPLKQIEIENKDCVLTESATLDNSQRYKEHQNNHGNKNLLDDELPVSYDGAQLWRIDFDDQHERNAVADLQHNFGKHRTFYWVLYFALWK